MVSFAPHWEFRICSRCAEYLVIWIFCHLLTLHHHLERVTSLFFSFPSFIFSFCSHLHLFLFPFLLPALLTSSSLTPFSLSLNWAFHGTNTFSHVSLVKSLLFLAFPLSWGFSLPEKPLFFMLFLGMCLYYLLWTYPLKNMSSWETFCGTTLAQEFTYPFPFPWNCSLLHRLRIYVMFPFLAIMDSQMGHGHVLPGSL